ncbi:Hypothetical predicted protein [Olea europaea subsp. europaea]|uniref:Uncharacterized protein n=1 Tax=Olea europaea subsp. europaea TaxID=158383 RepID=A0A8S0SD00_OLEEU|nr:Hypothetical predicted protein [Olea europaea subsp. europaea]
MEKLYGAIGEENRPDFCAKLQRRSRFSCNTVAIWEEEWIWLMKHIYRAKLFVVGICREGNSHLTKEHIDGESKAYLGVKNIFWVSSEFFCYFFHISSSIF